MHQRNDSGAPALRHAGGLFAFCDVPADHLVTVVLSCSEAPFVMDQLRVPPAVVEPLDLLEPGPGLRW